VNGNDTPHVEHQEFTAAQTSAVEEVIEKYRHRPGALIPVLEEVQEILGYVPQSIQMKVALGLGVPPGEVLGVLTFYSFFATVPRGRHTVRCCLGTACYVRGGQKILETLTSKLDIQPEATTPDGRFSLTTVRCLGACGLAPVIVVDEETFGQVKPARVPGLLEPFK